MSSKWAGSSCQPQNYSVVRIKVIDPTNSLLIKSNFFNWPFPGIN